MQKHLRRTKVKRSTGQIIRPFTFPPSLPIGGHWDHSVVVMTTAVCRRRRAFAKEKKNFCSNLMPNVIEMLWIESVDRLIDWLVGWLAVRLIDWLIGWPIELVNFKRISAWYLFFFIFFIITIIFYFTLFFYLILRKRKSCLFRR